MRQLFLHIFMLIYFLACENMRSSSLYARRNGCFRRLYNFMLMRNITNHVSALARFLNGAHFTNEAIQTF